MTDPAQPVEATPRSDEAGRVAVAIIATGPTSVTTFVEACKVVVECARDIERQLSLAQTENAGHIRIEDELKSDLAQAQARCAELEKALTRIEEWSSFPMAEWNGEPCSYGVAYGSNGERDYMRGIAKVALKASPKPSSR